MDLLSEIVSVSELGSNNQEFPEILLDSEDFYTTQNNQEFSHIFGGEMTNQQNFDLGSDNQEFPDIFGGDMTNQHNQENQEIVSVSEDFNDIFGGEMTNVAGNNDQIFNDLLSETGFSEVIPDHGK